MGELELHYKNIPRKIIATKYMQSIAGDLPDYKVYCFNGEPKFVQLIEGRFSQPRMAIYELDWQEAPFVYKFHGSLVEKPRNNAKPRQLERMLALSKKLSKGFALVRVDWYLIGDTDIYFGEMTFTPENGTQKWVPDGTDEYLGSLIELPKEKYIIK
ncbi:MAG: hypothetical protein LUI08_03935 [Prevotella sp.]|nr:hypothetical protein [Prevotella sp.]